MSRQAVGGWTAARGRALEAIAAHEKAGLGPIRVSNQTTSSSVYWQSADWLVENGFARVVVGGLELTDEGWKAL